jgi:hypothetical protein
MLAKGWNVEATRAVVARLKDVTADPPAWLAGRVAEAVTDIGYDHSSHFSQLVEIHAVRRRAVRDLQRCRAGGVAATD